MLKCSVGLIGVAGADLMKDRSADLWPSKLLNLSFNLEADLKCVSVCLRKVEVRGLEKNGAVLHAGGKNSELDVGRAERAEVFWTSISYEGVSLSVATGRCTNGLGSSK